MRDFAEVFDRAGLRAEFEITMNRFCSHDYRESAMKDLPPCCPTRQRLWN